MRKPQYIDWNSVPVTFGMDIATIVLGLCKTTVCKLIAEKKLHACKVGSKYIFDKDQVKAFIQGGSNGN